MASITTETKVGFLILVAIIIGALFTLKVGRCDLPWEEKGYIIYTILDSIPYLEENAPVKYAGVKVGKVQAIELFENKAKLTLYIKTFKNQEILIPRDSIAYVLVPLLGESTVEIKPGSRFHDPIHPGEELQGGPSTGLEQLGNQLSDVIQPLAEDLSVLARALREAMVDEEGTNRLDAIMVKLDDMLVASNHVLKDNRENIRDTMTNLKSVTKELDEFIRDNKNGIQSTMDNAQQSSEKFTSITDKLERVSEQMDNLLTKRNDDIDKSIGNIKEITEKLKTILESIDNVTKKIEKGEGSVGKLINDDELYNKVNSSLDSIDEGFGSTTRFLDKIRKVQGRVGITGEYLESHDKFKTYINFSLISKSGSMLDFQVVESPFKYSASDINDNSGENSKSYLEEERETLFSLLIGKQWWNFRLRGGMIESSGGLGLDYFMFNNKLKFSVEGWDLNREPDPHMKLYSDFQVYSHFLVHIGWDDLLNDDIDSFVFGLGVQYP